MSAAHDPHSDPGVELASRRTGMSFQRTRMSADRTLMAVMRTSLSLISFGFTIHQAFGRLQESGTLTMRTHAPRNFGVALVALGIVMLVLGIMYQTQFMIELRNRREEMTSEGLIHGQSHFPPSMTLVTAMLLLIIGVIAITSMLLRVGPFA